jgi:hypothetical protein
MPRGVPKLGFRKTKKKIQEAVTKASNHASVSRFTIDQRFGFIDQMVQLLAKGEQPSVIVCGPGGLGKSHSVTAALTKAGLKDISNPEEYEVGATLSRNTFRVVKGYSSPKGLFRTLYENRNGTIVFDDCDSVLKDQTALDLLKAALDSYSRRIISWNGDIKDQDLEQTFLFKGRVVFISNTPSCLMDQAVLTRSLVVDVSMTTEQKVERMRTIVKEPTFLPSYEMTHKKDALDLIGKLQDQVKELSLRTLIQVVKIRKSGGPKWSDLAEYAICG